MSDFELGAVLPIMEDGEARHVPSGTEIIAQARRAEELEALAPVVELVRAG